MLSDKVTNLIAFFLLGLMLLMAFFSMKQDSLTMDELSHIPAGYSYISQKDMRINPEHPPLIKDLAALPLIFMKINFPKDHPSWRENINDQWGFGPQFLFKSGNDADKIIFWARLPMLLIMLILGFYIFKWARELGGNRAGLIAVTLYSFSPTFLAHSRLVTTDVAAAAGIFIATYYFLKFLTNPSRKNLIIAGAVLGIALLTKFSVILLIPYFVLLLGAYFLIKSWDELSRLTNPQIIKKLFWRMFQYAKALVIIFTIGFLIIWPLYQYHVWSYPENLQKMHTDHLLADYGGGKNVKGIVGSLKRFPAEIAIWASDKPILRPYAHYLLGLLMVIHRAASGNTTFFWGQVANKAWRCYFPTVYAIKTPLALHILTVLALMIAASKIHPVRKFLDSGGMKKNSWAHCFKRVHDWFKEYFVEFSLLIFIAIYWATSIKGNLNIGVRHVLPTFPFVYILISKEISLWLRMVQEKDVVSFLKKLKEITKSYIIILGKCILVFILIFWYIGSSVKMYPHFIAHFNELVGGAKNGHFYAADSNLDWGQDMYRLVDFVEKNNIDKIRLHYFGGANPEYYLGEKFISWSPERGQPENGWFAISLTELQGRTATEVKGFTYKPEERYDWIKGYQPVERIGYSIFVYHFE